MSLSLKLELQHLFTRFFILNVLSLLSLAKLILLSACPPHLPNSAAPPLPRFSPWTPALTFPQTYLWINSVFPWIPNPCLSPWLPVTSSNCLLAYNKHLKLLTSLHVCLHLSLPVQLPLTRAENIVFHSVRILLIFFLQTFTEKCLLPGYSAIKHIGGLMQW